MRLQMSEIVLDGDILSEVPSSYLGIRVRITA